MHSRSGIKNYRVSFDFYVTPGVKLLLIANFAVFIFEALLYRFSGPSAYIELLKWFGLVPAGVIPLLHIWQPFTYLFLHDVNSIWHILTNMIPALSGRSLSGSLSLRCSESWWALRLAMPNGMSARIWGLCSPITSPTLREPGLP